MRAALYARVSSEEQRQGYNFDAQRRSFRSLLESGGWIAYREYIEEGRSALTDDIRRRPVFREALAAGAGRALPLERALEEVEAVLELHRDGDASPAPIP